MMNPMPKLTQVLSLLYQKENQRNHISLVQPTVKSAALVNRTVNNILETTRMLLVRVMLRGMIARKVTIEGIIWNVPTVMVPIILGIDVII